VKFDFWRKVEKAAEHRRSPKRFAHFEGRHYFPFSNNMAATARTE
jgi:hypothetical protein